MIDAIYAVITADTLPLPRPLLLGINGAYTAGKTEFANGLESHLNALGTKTQLIHYDDFHRPFDTITWVDPDDEIDAFYNRAFDPDKLIREVFEPLHQYGHLKTTLDCVNLGTGEFTNRVDIDIDDHTIILIEGALLLRPPILDHLDYTVYLDIAPDEMIRRGWLRDAPRFGDWIMDKYASRYIPVHQCYESDHKPKTTADILIDNTDWRNPVITRKRGASS